jgi:type I restriction enzyme S subunit
MKGRRAYPAYKDSGVEWLGRVPQSWQIDRLKWTTTKCRNGIWGSEPDGIYDIPCIRVADFDRNKLRIILNDLTLRSITPSERKGRLLKHGNLLLEKSGGGDLQPVGTVMLFDQDLEAVCSNFIARMPVRSVWDSNYLVYLHAHLYARRVNTRSIKQTTGIQNIDLTAYLNELIACPSISEQHAIAAFLDRETARIDALVEKKERQIKLLKEKRSALISHVVTKGLNPDAPMKDSGIEWLGEIPEEWRLKRLKYCVSRINDKVEGLNSDLSYTGLEHIKPWTGKRINEESNATSDGHSNRYKQGDVLFGKLRPYLAKVLRVNNVGICTGELLVIRPRLIEQNFLFYYMLAREFIFIVDSSTYGAKMPRANWEFIGNLPILLPSPKEQRAIADFLDRETGRIDTMIEKVEESIEKLYEYRSALISAAVTGKIDVRGEVA